MISVGILGAGWGRTHVGTFRAAGCHVRAIVASDPARSRAVADAQGIERSDVEALGEVDVVVIATPTCLRDEHLARHAKKKIFCEKPLLAKDPPEDVWVGYAFSFLDASQAVLARVGRIDRIACRTGLRRFDRPYFPLLMDAAVHPVSLAMRLGVSPSIEMVEDPEAIITQRVTIHGEPTLEVEGIFDGAWRFAARENGRVIGAWGDQWYEAHRRMVAVYVEMLEGRIDAPAAKARGLFDRRAAQAVDGAMAAAPRDVGMS
jgi:hypothetical protein